MENNGLSVTVEQVQAELDKLASRKNSFLKNSPCAPDQSPASARPDSAHVLRAAVAFRLRGSSSVQSMGCSMCPFPSLPDATGQSLRNFSIKALGTHVLIDPEGNVFKGDGEKALENGLLKMIKKAQAKKRKKLAP